MPRYFFNLCDHENDIDEDGVELADEAAARIEAVRYAADYASNNPNLVVDGRPLIVNVLDADRVILLEVVMRTGKPDNEIRQV